jgi:hypothetical protein
MTDHPCSGQPVNSHGISEPGLVYEMRNDCNETVSLLT